MKRLKGPHQCPVCEFTQTLNVKKPGPLQNTVIFVRCPTCHCRFRVVLRMHKQGVLVTDFLLELSEMGLTLVMEDPELFKRIKTPFLAREILRRFRKNGEKIGYLVQGQIGGKETPLEEASDEQCMRAAQAVIQSEAHSSPKLNS